jgi:O-antigen/teichoic acid export membrane protein
MVFKDSFFRHGSIIFFFSVLGYLCGYLFHIYMGRTLGPEDYGTLGSIIAVVSIATIPAGAIQVAIANFVSRLMAKEDYGRIKSLFLRSFRKLLMYGFFVFVAVALASPLFSWFLNIPSNVPLILIGISIIFSFASPVNLGVLQGIQNFKYFGLAQSLSHIIRLVAGVSLVSLGMGINGAALSYPIAIVLVILVTLIPMKHILREKADKSISKHEIYRYYWPVLVAFAGFTIIMNMDVILAKHFFPAEQAGFYAAAAVLSKIAFFLSGIVTAVMFPKAVDMHSKTDSALPMLKKGVAYMCGLLVILVLAYITMPGIIISILFGSAYLEVAGMLGPLSVAMSFLAVSNVIAFYNMSINRMGFIYIILAVALAEIPFMFLFHSSIAEFIWVVFFSMAALLGSLTLYMLRTDRK